MGRRILLGAAETGPRQRLAAEDGEPDFHLIHPRCMGGGEVEMDVGVASSQRSRLGLWVLRLSRITWICGRDDRPGCRS